ncbi:ABC transporter permease [Bacillus sp. sid0103]|uniref:ABC transporter permease n=1 Tax=Bacillus sp. sid0103 TaxID=2856337 RepID=UPI001C4825A9|nr:ABC transporter permease [Bacillus sp. sid0103]MBV7504236.1 ABC transporter permease [Bacillus sp. sid0103]
MLKKFSFMNSSLLIMAMAVLVFLYLPLIVVTIYSFNPDSVNSFPMRGFSLKWYHVMAENEVLIESLKNSVVVALMSTFFAICLGVPGAFLVDRFNFPGKKLFERIVLLPLMLPGILTGVALLNFFQELGIGQSMTAVVIGHTTFLIAVIMTQVYARLKRLDRNLEQASYDLGASRIQTFFYVILPLISTSLIGASMLAFTLSLDEIPVTFFLNGVFSTLPLQIWGMTRNGITPEVNAISTVVFVSSIVLIIISTIITKEEGRRA